MSSAEVMAKTVGVGDPQISDSRDHQNIEIHSLSPMSSVEFSEKIICKTVYVEIYYLHFVVWRNKPSLLTLLPQVNFTIGYKGLVLLAIAALLSGNFSSTFGSLAAYHRSPKTACKCTVMSVHFCHSKAEMWMERNLKASALPVFCAGI